MKAKRYVPLFEEFCNEGEEPLLKTFVPDFSERYYGEFDKQIEQSRNDRNERIREFCENFHKKHPNQEDCKKCKEAYKHNAYSQTHYSLLAELMAKHVHDTWMAQRVKNGWKYGEHRDDKKKTHPCIVPYEELPESEKEYDRQTSLETINFLREQGFKIVQENED